MTNATIRVLLADDHAVVRAGIRQFLEQAAGIRVVAEADDGREARELIARLQPDVAVLDIQMPHASGIEVTRWVRRQGLPVGLLILTAYDDEPYVTAVLEAGANGFVLKTATPAAIVQAVRDVFGGKEVVDVPRPPESPPGGPPAGDDLIVEALTERELEVLALAAKGQTNKAIGVMLGISDRTVQGHLARIYRKLAANSRTEAVMKGVSLGLIDAELGS